MNGQTTLCLSANKPESANLKQKNTKETLHIQQEMHDGAFIANFGLTDELNQRFQSMRTRNQKLQEELL